jgi:hypothetical protein
MHASNRVFVALQPRAPRCPRKRGACVLARTYRSGQHMQRVRCAASGSTQRRNVYAPARTQVHPSQTGRSMRSSRPSVATPEAGCARACVRPRSGRGCGGEEDRERTCAMRQAAVRALISPGEAMQDQTNSAPVSKHPPQPGAQSSRRRRRCTARASLAGPAPRARRGAHRRRHSRCRSHSRRLVRRRRLIAAGLLRNIIRRGIAAVTVCVIVCSRCRIIFRRLIRRVIMVCIFRRSVRRIG